ncbi:hypothetical protein QN345_15505, partial [Cryobacterium sp. 10I1]|nr:hypothetical protein [Cryobacterium sp. 10I1]
MSPAVNLGSTGLPGGPEGQGGPGRAGVPADSAGQPWAGRAFEANDHADDDGSAPLDLLAALARYRDRESG